jgi:hypothetical protein
VVQYISITTPPGIGKIKGTGKIFFTSYQSYRYFTGNRKEYQERGTRREKRQLKMKN